MAQIKRYDAIDGLRAYAAIGIVAMHVMTNGGFNLPQQAFRIIGSMGEFVYLFMAVSGFSMCCGYYDRVLSGSLSIVDFYKRRFSKVLPFFALLCLIDFATNPSLATIYEVFADVTLCFGLLPNPTMSVVGVGWFLGLVFVFYLVFPFFCFLLENKRRAWFSFAVALIYNYLCSTYFFNDAHVVPGFDFRTNILFCSVYFLLGGLVFLYRFDLAKFVIKKPIVLVVLTIAGCISIVAYGMNTIGALAAIIGLLVLALKSPSYSLLFNPATRFISSISLEIYLSHMMCFRILQLIGLIKYFGTSTVSYLVCLISVLALSTCFISMTRQIPKIKSKLIGK